MRPASAALAFGQGEGVASPSAAAVPAAGALTARFLPAAERLDALRPEWQALAAKASEPNPFCETWFVAASVRHLARSPVRIAEIRDGSGLVGLMPLVTESRYGRVPVKFSQNWRHHHLFLGSPLVRAGQEEAFWRGLLVGLDQQGWAAAFLHLRDLVEGGPLHRGLKAAAAALGRPAKTVYREERAFLQSSLGADAYYEQSVRKKKRKELARLRNRLAEMGPLSVRALADGDDLSAWCDTFLQLEASGWKGREGTALACRSETETFFREAMAGALGQGRLQFLRMDVGDRPVAMLINFLAPPGSFSFKTAFDEDFARFSPGVLIQLDNLKILERPGIAWMDSCAAEQHPMIDSLWAERRPIIRVTVPLSGARRRIAYTAARALEEVSAARRRLTRGGGAQAAGGTDAQEVIG
ncbi:MAG TPA: GNAT family N-acetyltransferase [Allosphingosinicella sp.]